uniref:Glutathione S-transferase zeta 1 n=1 Tax=Salmo trutta TaxID=8032 RepID=A0A673XDK9_SALTR
MQQVPAVQIDGITLSQSLSPMMLLSWLMPLCLSALEPIWKETAGKYCVGDEISMADICLIPQVYNAELDVDQFPTIKRLNQTLLKVDAFKESHPSCQLDTPAEICT